MASVINDPNGFRRIQFTDRDGNRKTVRLGRTDRRGADRFRSFIQRILSAAIQNAPLDTETASWLADLSDTMHGRLAATGLVKARKFSTLALGAFLDQYIADRPDVKPATRLVYGHTRRCLVAYFGADRPLRDISPGDADQWRTVFLNNREKLADNTIRRRTGIAKQFFRAAQRRKLINENPFEGLKCTLKEIAEREFQIDRATSRKVIEGCPDAQWRLIFALSRFGGLRCPSEHLSLKWADIDWEHSRFTVHSPKTEHHEGKGSRQVPIFPELLPHLRECFEKAVPGTEYVITRYRNATQNLGTQFTRILQSAGVKPWPKLFHNLRASRQTELADIWPEHVVCKWLGNSKLVARKSYLRVTEAHFAKAAQKAAQQVAQPSEIESNPEIAVEQNPPVFTDDFTPLHSLQDFLMGGEGLEPTTFAV
jgi:integrase